MWNSIKEWIYKHPWYTFWILLFLIVTLLIIAAIVVLFFVWLFSSNKTNIKGTKENPIQSIKNKDYIVEYKLNITFINRKYNLISNYDIIINFIPELNIKIIDKDTNIEIIKNNYDDFIKLIKNMFISVIKIQYTSSSKIITDLGEYKTLVDQRNYKNILIKSFDIDELLNNILINILLSTRNIKIVYDGLIFDNDEKINDIIPNIDELTISDNVYKNIKDNNLVTRDLIVNLFKKNNIKLYI